MYAGSLVVIEFKEMSRRDNAQYKTKYNVYMYEEKYEKLNNNDSLCCIGHRSFPFFAIFVLYDLYLDLWDKYIRDFEFSGAAKIDKIDLMW